MRTRATWMASLLALAVLGTAAPVPAVAAAGANDPCAAAQQELEQGNWTQAQHDYTELLPAQACAKQGLAAISELSAARQLVAVGLMSQADAEIVRALETVPSLRLPPGIVPATVGLQGEQFADALDADGFHDQARQVLLQVVQNEPAFPLDPTARGILGLNGTPWYRRLWHQLTTPLMLTIEGLVLFILVGLYPRMRRRLHLQAFTVSDAPGAGTDPADLRLRVWKELRWLTSEHARRADGRTDHGGRLRLDLAGPYENQLDLDQFGDLFGPPWKVIVMVTNVLLGRIRGKARLVTGVLLPDISVRLGLETVTGGSDCDTVIVHEHLSMPDPPPGTDSVRARYAQLALPAAVWIILNHYKKYALSGTQDWRSFVLFAVGRAWEDAGDLQRAGEFYFAAWNEDKANAAAACNLARLLQQGLVIIQSAPSWDVLLQSVVEATEGQTDDPQWFRSRYHLSHGLVDLGRPGPTGSTPSAADTDKVREYAKDLAVDLAVALERKAADPGDLPEEFIRNSRGAALILAARQLVPTTSDLTQVSTRPLADQAGYAGETAIDLLTGRGKGTPERLVAYVVDTCRVTPEEQVNLYLYKQNRVRISSEAIDAIERQLRNGTAEDAEALAAQRQQLEQAAESDGTELAALRREIANAGDPVLLAAIDHAGAGFSWDDGIRPRDMPDRSAEAESASTGLGWPTDAPLPNDAPRPPGEPAADPAETTRPLDLGSV